MYKAPDSGTTNPSHTINAPCGAYTPLRNTMSTVAHVRLASSPPSSFSSHQPRHIPLTRLAPFYRTPRPQSIKRHGNLKALLKLRPRFRASVDVDTFSPPLMMLLKTLKPWLAGDMHVRFEAEVKHARDADGSRIRRLG